MKPIIEIEESAREFLRAKLVKENQEAVVFMLEAGGCAGASFAWKPMSLAEATEKYAGGDYGVFDLGAGKHLVVDKLSEIHLLGSTITVKDDFAGHSIDVKSPNAVSACGCGTSVNFGI